MILSQTSKPGNYRAISVMTIKQISSTKIPENLFSNIYKGLYNTARRNCSQECKVDLPSENQTNISNILHINRIIDKNRNEQSQQTERNI